MFITNNKQPTRAILLFALSADLTILAAAINRGVTGFGYKNVLNVYEVTSYNKTKQRLIILAWH